MFKDFQGIQNASVQQKNVCKHFCDFEQNAN